MKAELTGIKSDDKEEVGKVLEELHLEAEHRVIPVQLTDGSAGKVNVYDKRYAVEVRKGDQWENVYEGTLIECMVKLGEMREQEQ